MNRDLDLVNSALMAKLVRRHTSNVEILSSNLSEGSFFLNAKNSPNSIATCTISGGDLKEPLTGEEKKFYSQIFKTLDLKHTGSLSGLAAKPLLEASNLSPPILGEIWNIADPDNKGVLDQFGFCVAMRLIGHVQHGATLTADLYQSAPSQLARFNTIPISHTGGSLPSNNTGSRISSASSVDSQQVVVPVLSPQQAQNFGAMFDKSAPSGVLPGLQARDIFLKARLPTPILEKIWNLVDQSQSGQLKRPQFIVAMHLIQSFLSKSMTILPTVIPDPIWAVANSPSQPQSPIPHQLSGGSTGSGSTNLNTWIMSSQQKQQYGAVFDNLDKSKTGKISGDEVAKFLMTSKLPNDTLATIWELSNLDGSDSFNKQEFSIAMYLVQKKISGFDLPPETPAQLLQTSTVTELPRSSTVPPPLPASPTAPVQNVNSAKSHLDDLLDVFGQPARTESARPAVPPVPASRSVQPESGASGQRSGFVPTSNFGRQLQTQNTQEPQSSDDEDGPEDLDKKPVRATPPVIPGRAQKPHFDDADTRSSPVPKESSGPNYEALRTVGSPQPSSQERAFTSTPFTQQTTGSFSDSGASPQLTSGFSNQPQLTGQAAATDREVSNKLSQASVDIANFSNQINSLTVQTTNVNSKRDKAQKELSRIMKVKEGIEEKLAQLKTLYEREVQQVQEVESVLITSRNESESLKQELALAEANYHSEQSKLQKLQLEVEETQKANQTTKERLGVLNAESIDLNQQIESLSQKLKQTHNMHAVASQQVASQEQENNQLRSKIESITQSIKDIELKHSQLLTRSNELEDENYDLHQQHGNYSAQFAEKNLNFSTALASGAAVLGGGAAALLAATHGGHKSEESEKEQAKEPAQDEEVPTASLDNFDDNDFSVPSAEELRRNATESVSNTTGFDSSTKSRSEPATSQTSELDDGSQSQQQFSLPFGIPHSETSSIQNNPSQSVRGDFDVPDSPTSTIEEEAAPPIPVLSSQVLPEGEEVTEPISSNDNGESFEMVDHDDAKESALRDVSAPQYTMPGSMPGEFAGITESQDTVSKATTEVSGTTEAGEPAAPVEEEDDLYSPATKAVHPEGSTSELPTPDEPTAGFPKQTPSLDDLKPADEESSDNEEFHDSISSPTRFNAGEEPREPKVADKSTNPFSAAKNTDMFDDLGLEEAHAEDSFNTSQFDNFNSFDGSAPGFSVSEPVGGADAGQAGAAANDDWEQVFAGFGNDPNLQPAVNEFDSPPVYQANESDAHTAAAKSDVPDSTAAFSQSQQMAIDELEGMGFDEAAAVNALQKNNWQLDLATNFLLDSA
ncbi:hypothetical protein OGAPHI_003687 [Ogataea philodendri]|uniref:Uncharacterized protein n=1 Tax=Ogataea philodendri TaxID=1378263 RepID=A0A9P8P5M2_9ASCO|nr:uncharacterized protein OGAPHI_003687 [Ogataea philodendri]KAH3665501.1 hypothetical protein OGAPHI_003687 [Ogataea philodendri]